MSNEGFENDRFRYSAKRAPEAVGPIKHQSDKVIALLRSAETAVHLVTVLEEMPVQETVDAVAELTATGLPAGGNGAVSKSWV